MQPASENASKNLPPERRYPGQFFLVFAYLSKATTTAFQELPCAGVRAENAEMKCSVTVEISPEDLHALTGEATKFRNPPRSPSPSRETCLFSPEVYGVDAAAFWAITLGVFALTGFMP